MSWSKILAVTAVVVCVFGIATFDCAEAVEIEVLEKRIAKLEALLLGVSRDGDDITFEGVNVYIVSGSGSTDGEVNGLGNLIVGYNEPRPSGSVKTGSHNIVVGLRHNYALYGGMVVGNTNEIVGAYATVSGGMNNQAFGYASSVSGGYNNMSSHLFSSVSGGSDNTASGQQSSVSGGRNNLSSGLNAFVGGGGGTVSAHGNEAYADYSAILGGRKNITGDPASDHHWAGSGATVSGGHTNEASGGNSSVSGGSFNTASGDISSVSGGDYNTASGWQSSVNGGSGNTASGQHSSINGGGINTASGFVSSVSGGRFNIASGRYSFAGGGGGNRESDGNEAFASFSSILGGWRNIAGDPDLEDHDIGRQSVVCAGSNNVASGNRSAVTGGYYNTASAANASVSGGRDNSASALGASVSGGNMTSVANRFDWAAGDLYEAD